MDIENLPEPETAQEDLSYLNGIKSTPSRRIECDRIRESMDLDRILSEVWD